MVKYILTQPFKKVFSVNGVDYYFDKKQGDVVEGVLTSSTQGNTQVTGSSLANAKYLRVKFNIVGNMNRFIFIPLDILMTMPRKGSNTEVSPFEGADSNTELNQENKSTIFTLKNVVIGLVVVGVAYGVLKATKVIK